MDKTPIRTKFVKQLVRVDDQLCFAALGRHEFGRTLGELVRASPKEFTTAAFADIRSAPSGTGLVVIGRSLAISS